MEQVQERDAEEERGKPEVRQEVIKRRFRRCREDR